MRKDANGIYAQLMFPYYDTINIKEITCTFFVFKKQQQQKTSLGQVLHKKYCGVG